MTVTVGPDRDYTTISEAVQAIPADTRGVIEISEGRYHEKLFIEKRDITLIGAGMGRTVIEYDDCANDVMADGTRRGTFRSWTMFLGGERSSLRDLSVVNSAWDTDMNAGQALAVYADADRILMENVELVSRQDTLFLSPLPYTERQPGGFFGPRMLTDRKPTRQYYRKCRIIGDVDFIFGGADAVFEDCEIIVRDRGREINGYITAPSESCGELGFVFYHCEIKGENDHMKGTVFLGRPWRPTGKAFFLECRYDDCINERRFSEWKTVEAETSEAFFAEYHPMDSNGRPLDISQRNPWVRILDDDEADVILKEIRKN